MNYNESQEILEEIKKAKQILVNCHRGPDPDSVGSALALSRVLENLGKEVKVVCPGEELPQNLKFLNGFDKIELIDFSTFDFSKFDLFITLDSANWYMVSGSKDIPLPKLPILAIDHHLTNERYGKTNLVDIKVSSTAELLYRILGDLGIKIDVETASCLLVGVISDSGGFMYPGVGISTFEVAAKLIEAGANKDKIVFNILGIDFRLLKSWGKIIENAQMDQAGKFYWSAISHKIFVEMGEPEAAKDTFASTFGQTVDATDFSIVMVEQKPRDLRISFRSRTDFDSSNIAVALGGGGHRAASGARVVGLPFEDAVKKVLETARRFINENKI